MVFSVEQNASYFALESLSSEQAFRIIQKELRVKTTVIHDTVSNRVMLFVFATELKKGLFF
jgi:hypothetical protein